jgi:pimeloyl-ACP methyl ester carboxylesterase
MGGSPERRVPVLLLPGLVCDSAVWTHASDALRTRTEVTIAAYGSLDSLGAMADKVLQEAPPRFAIAGHSMGGRIALEVLRRTPERLAGIALLDTGVQPLPDGEAGEREINGRHELVQIAYDRGMAQMAARWVQGMIWGPRLHETALVATVIDMFVRSSASIFDAQIRALLARPCAGALLPGIRCPALVLCGEQDNWAPADRHREMAANIPGAQLVLVPECGHMSTLERPQTVTRALLEWYARVA